jgi:hypothetical protein
MLLQLIDLCLIIFGKNDIARANPIEMRGCYPECEILPIWRAISRADPKDWTRPYSILRRLKITCYGSNGLDSKHRNNGSLIFLVNKLANSRIN